MGTDSRKRKRDRDSSENSPEKAEADHKRRSVGRLAQPKIEAQENPEPQEQTISSTTDADHSKPEIPEPEPEITQEEPEMPEKPTVEPEKDSFDSSKWKPVEKDAL